MILVFIYRLNPYVPSSPTPPPPFRPGGRCPALLRPETYPHRPRHITHLQTHISHVFLTGGQVFKVKKPIRYDFLDFSTLARRGYFCRQEVGSTGA